MEAMELAGAISPEHPASKPAVRPRKDMRVAKGSADPEFGGVLPQNPMP